jgi:Icc protein
MNSTQFLNILQITDIHFREKVDGTIYGVETQSLFERTLRQIKEDIWTSGRPIDVLLVTGDISQDGSAESYRRFHEFIEPLEIPSYFLQGNHDYSAPMLKEFGAERVAPCKVNAVHLQNSPWQIVLVNSSVENQVGGHFGEEQIQYLKNTLTVNPESPTLICFHHHPLPINSEWLDKQKIDDTDDFFEVVDQFSNIKLGIYGHIHQNRETVRNKVPYFATPSTCAQFAPEQKDFALDNEMPAYRWIHLFEDGRFETEVVRLKNK